MKFEKIVAGLYVSKLENYELQGNGRSSEAVVRRSHTGKGWISFYQPVGDFPWGEEAHRTKKEAMERFCEGKA